MEQGKRVRISGNQKSILERFLSAWHGGGWEYILGEDRKC